MRILMNGKVYQGLCLEEEGRLEGGYCPFEGAERKVNSMFVWDKDTFVKECDNSAGNGGGGTKKDTSESDKVSGKNRDSLKEENHILILVCMIVVGLLCYI